MSTVPNTLSLSHGYVSTWVPFGCIWMDTTVPLHRMLSCGRERRGRSAPAYPVLLRVCARPITLTRALPMLLALSRAPSLSACGEKKCSINEKKSSGGQHSAHAVREREREREREKRERETIESLHHPTVSECTCACMSVICVCKFHLRTHPPPAAMQIPHGEQNAFKTNSASVGKQTLEVQESWRSRATSNLRLICPLLPARITANTSFSECFEAAGVIVYYQYLSLSKP